MMYKLYRIYKDIAMPFAFFVKKARFSMENAR